MSRISILLVDDHPMVREGLVARFQSVPRFEVVGEAGGRVEALDQLSRCEPDVVVMDVGLKDGNGITLAAELLALRPALKLLTPRAKAGVLWLFGCSWGAPLEEPRSAEARGACEARFKD
jgi:CheY-like chemotaxis protein